MKKINKRILDKCIELTRTYYTEDYDETNVKYVQMRLEEAKKAEVDWYALVRLLDGILFCGGFKPDASNWDVYLVLRLLGWEVVDEEIEESESL